MIEPMEPGYYWYRDDSLQSKILCKVTINSANEPNIEFFDSDYNTGKYYSYPEEMLRDLHPEFAKVEPELVLNRNGKDPEECLGISRKRAEEIVYRCQKITNANSEVLDSNGKTIVKVIIDNNFSLKEKIFAICVTMFELCRYNTGVLL